MPWGRLNLFADRGLYAQNTPDIAGDAIVDLKLARVG